MRAPTKRLVAAIAGGAAFVGAYMFGAHRLGANVRIRALKIVRAVVPATEGDPAWGVVTKDFGGIGTTCGFLAHYLLAELGDKRANRDGPGTSYRVGKNIAAIASHPAFRRWTGGPERPKPGDIYLQSDGPPMTEHVGVVIRWDSDARVLTADYGQRTDGKPSGKYLEKYLDAAGVFQRRDGVPGRKLVGWIDLDKLAS